MFGWHRHNGLSDVVISCQLQLLPLCMYDYSLGPGVCFDLLKFLYKTDPSHTRHSAFSYLTTVRVSDTLTLRTIIVLITPGSQATNQSKHPIMLGSGSIHDLCPRVLRALGRHAYNTSQIPQWGVLTNTHLTI